MANMAPAPRPMVAHCVLRSFSGVRRSHACSVPSCAHSWSSRSVQSHVARCAARAPATKPATSPMVPERGSTSVQNRIEEEEEEEVASRCANHAAGARATPAHPPHCKPT